MNRVANIYDVLLDELELHFPELAKNAVNWYPSGRHEITVKLNDGQLFTYNSTLKGVRFIRRSEDKGLSESELRDEFRDRLYKTMLSKGISQLELAEMTGISNVTISNYFNGKSIPSLYNVSLLARALECSISELTDF